MRTGPNAAAAAPARRLAVAFPVVLATLVALAYDFGPALLVPARAFIGSLHSEAPGHLWGLWTAADGIFTTGPLRRVAEYGWPKGWDAHLMDPVNLLVFAPVYWIGGKSAASATLGWNGLHVASVILGGWGCHRLGLRLAGSSTAARWGTGLMVLVVCASPFMAAYTMSGRTEFLPGLLYPLHLSYLHEWLRRPSRAEPRIAGGLTAPPGWRVGVLAGLTLGAMALAGSYLAVFTALLEIPLAAGLAWRLRWWEAAWRLLFVAALAVVILSPGVYALIRWPPDIVDVTAATGPSSVNHMSRDVFAEQFRVAVRHQQNKAMDAFNYLGWVGMGGALLALVLRFRAALVWVATGAWVLSLAVGPFYNPLQPVPGAEPLPLPVHYLASYLPYIGFITNWNRIGVIGVVPVAAATLLGFSALFARRQWLAPIAAVGLGALALWDHATWPNERPGIPASFDAALPESVVRALATLPPGPIVQYPLDVSLIRGAQERGKFLVWQRQHLRPISATPARGDDSTLRWNALSQLVYRQENAAVTARGGTLFTESAVEQPPPPPTVLQLRQALTGAYQLRAAGFVGVVYHPFEEGGADIRDVLIAVLGAATYAEDPVAVWDLAKALP